MNKVKYPKHYVGIVPIWLANLLSRTNASLDHATCYAKLSAITSPSDVCFYHLHQLKISQTIGKQFDDMCSVAFDPMNLAWLEKNATALESAKVEFDMLCKKHGDDIMGDDVPALLRKYDYVPRAVAEHTLLLVACEETPLPNARSFYKACIEELNKQMTFDRCKMFNVFKSYCIA